LQATLAQGTVEIDGLSFRFYSRRLVFCAKAIPKAQKVSRWKTCVRRPAQGF
jgi:hypothetical protein